MGVCMSNRNLIPARNPGQASAFYWACRNGDMATVEKMLPNLTYEEVNQIEPNGSTALHAASFYDQPGIVRLLLASGCSRTVLNYNGMTAFQEAATDRIRVLFNRPTSNRFLDEQLTNSFQLVTEQGDNVEMKDGIPDDWFKGHISADSAHEAQLMIAMANSSNPLKQIVKNRTEIESTQTLNELVSTAVPQQHKHYKYISDLKEKFLNKMGISHLLTMYTLETPFYNTLQTEADSFTVLLYFHLNELQDRAFQGWAYRGGTMSQSDISAYRWALTRDDYVLETRTVQSMSLKKKVAQEFAEGAASKDKQTDRHLVLLTFNFPQKCPTAINLTRISETLPCLSAYGHEEEVTLLPFTLFSVKDIKTDSNSGQYRIALTNVPTPKTSLLAAMKHVES
ncbi:unnamed protein product [Adineta steineri]|uniref:Uncharacterized protein n=1 Tax=Adineta steineri TaxID=433720 RepID=A0A816EUV3_9BILA|nr:unnamed protein product [Adineta steineri]CAF1654229.1 unnamed protein product [Adineta steineri]